MGGQTPRELAREFGAIRAQRPDIEKPVHHVSISAGESDRLTVEQWQEIASQYIKEMGFENSPHIVIQHRDQEHDHIHIVASRVDAHAKVVSEWQSKNRAEEIMRAVEEKYDLERVQPSRENLRALPTRGERETFNRTGKLSARMSMQGRIELALKDGPTVTEFIDRLQHLLDQVNPVHQLEKLNPLHELESQLRTAQTIGRGIAEGYNIAKDLLSRQDATERLQQSAGLDPNGRDAVERLQQAAGVEPIKGEHEAVERLNQAAGVEREYGPPDPAHAPDKALEPGAEITPALERAATQEVEEHALEYTIELLL